MRDRLRAVARQSIEPTAALAALEELAAGAAARLEDCADPFLVDLANLLVISPPMLDALRRHPEWTGWLARAVESPADARERRRQWREEHGEAVDFLEDLRAYQRRAYLEIAYRDIAGLDSFEETSGALSALADLVIGEVLEHCRVQVFGENARLRPPEGFAVLSLGKLGGGELNYSSDVDLMFCRRNSPEREEERLFTRLGEMLVRVLGRPGPEGFLYRVDMRLRPYGAAGPLVPSLDSLTTYYESWGEAWERQALIKLRPTAGDPELGRRFADFAERYVFARPMDDAALEEIKTVKHRAEREHAGPSDVVDFKHGPGGIRDIEFYVQFHQLIAGARDARARARSTLRALEALAEARVLLEGELAPLALGYLMQRTVEHRLQLRALTPREALPESPAELELLARGLGYGGVRPAGDALRAALGACRARVREIVERVYLTPGYLRLREREEEFARLLSERTPRERVRELLAGYGFADIDRAWRNLRLMALGPDGRMLGPGERRAFLEIVFPLLEVVREALDPDQALHRLESFAAATGNRVSFLRVLASRRAHLARLANLLALSNLCHQVLVRHPEYFDSLARGIHLHEGRTAEEMYRELAGRFGASPRGDERENVIRRYRQRETVRIAYRDLAGLADALEISGELSDLAAAVVRAAAELARAPESAFAPEEIAPLRIVALGKMGGRQMHYSSDLDLVFLYDDPPEDLEPERRAAIQRELEARVKRMLELLAGVTSEGVAYRVDLRLRPEGSGGLPVRSWQGFMDYARRYMQPWERMALVRSRMLWAAEDAARRWRNALGEIAYGCGWDEASYEELRRLKRRIEAEKSRESRSDVDFKFGKGGITDLEFLVQFLQLRFGGRHPEVQVPEMAAALAALAQAGTLPGEEAGLLAEAHRFQRRVENHYQLMEEWPAREISRESPALALLARSLGYGGSSAGEARSRFLADWGERARFVRRMLEFYFYG